MTGEGGLIVALCGESGAGKSTTAEILRATGFEAFSPTAALRREAEARLGRPTRAEVQAHARATQAREGADCYLRRMLDAGELLSAGRAVIDGLRNLAELDLLRARAAAAGRRCALVAVLADPDRRFARITARARPGDPADADAFARDDARARGEARDAFQQNAALIAAADHRIMNDGDVDALRARTCEMVERLSRGPA